VAPNKYQSFNFLVKIVVFLEQPSIVLVRQVLNALNFEFLLCFFENQKNLAR
jgi:hypothetical protein